MLTPHKSTPISEYGCVFVGLVVGFRPLLENPPPLEFNQPGLNMESTWSQVCDFLTCFTSLASPHLLHLTCFACLLVSGLVVGFKPLLEGHPGDFLTCFASRLRVSSGSLPGLRGAFHRRRVSGGGGRHPLRGPARVLLPRPAHQPRGGPARASNSRERELAMDRARKRWLALLLF